MTDKQKLLDKKSELDHEIFALQTEKNKLIQALIKNRKSTFLKNIHQINLKLAELQSELEYIRVMVKFFN